MIYNATLIRLDPPEPGAPGPDVNVRCATAPLTGRQVQASAAWEAPATSVVYVPTRTVPSPGPAVGGQALLRVDGAADATLHPIVRIIERPGRTLGHVQVYLGDPL